MIMIPVKSSNISRVGYDGVSEKLFVKFKNGKTFCYNDVTLDEYAVLVNADSVGKHFNQYIKAVKVGREVKVEPEVKVDLATAEQICSLSLKLESMTRHMKEIEKLSSLEDGDQEVLAIAQEALKISMEKDNV